MYIYICDDASKCDDWECRYSFNRIFQRIKKWENMFRILHILYVDDEIISRQETFYCRHTRRIEREFREIMTHAESINFFLIFVHGVPISTSTQGLPSSTLSFHCYYLGWLIGKSASLLLFLIKSVLYIIFLWCHIALIFITFNSFSSLTFKTVVTTTACCCDKHKITNK